MRFYIIFIIILISLVILSSFLILTFNTDIILIDLFFLEVHIGLGRALLFSVLTGFLIAFILELLSKFNKKKKAINL